MSATAAAASAAAERRAAAQAAIARELGELDKTLSFASPASALFLDDAGGRATRPVPLGARLSEASPLRTVTKKQRATAIITKGKADLVNELGRSVVGAGATLPLDATGLRAAPDAE
jgi:hypothetical protein